MFFTDQVLSTRMKERKFAMRLNLLFRTRRWNHAYLKRSE